MELVKTALKLTAAVLAVCVAVSAYTNAPHDEPGTELGSGHARTPAGTTNKAGAAPDEELAPERELPPVTSQGPVAVTEQPAGDERREPPVTAPTTAPVTALSPTTAPVTEPAMAARADEPVQQAQFSEDDMRYFKIMAVVSDMPALWQQAARLVEWRYGIHPDGLQSWGRWDPRTNRVYINYVVFDNGRLYDVVAHELVHVIDWKLLDLGANPAWAQMNLPGVKAYEAFADCGARLIGATWTNYWSCEDPQSRAAARTVLGL